jgi:Rrp15p
MARPPSKKQKVEDGMRGKVARPKKRIRKQKEYHSSSEDSDAALEGEYAPVHEVDSEDDRETGSATMNRGGDDTDVSTTGQNSNSEEDASSPEDENGGEDGTGPGKKGKLRSKRNDPDTFSTSISKILSTKLSKGARKDPVLSRSRKAAAVSSGIANDKLEKRAKTKMRADRKEELERSRVKDVLGLEAGMAGEVAEEEKQLRKIAQRGVIKLFNAVRAAQVKGEEAVREAREKGTVGYANREEKINEMSKQGFLDLINGDRKTKPVEEAR